MRTTMKTTLKTMMVALAVLVGATVAHAAGWTTEVRQKVEKGSRLTIRATSGTVTVTGTDSDEITVESSDDRRDIPALTLRGDRPGTYLLDATGRGEVNLRVSVPRGMMLEEVSTRSADLTLVNLGAVSVTTSSGNVSGNTLGVATIKTRSGDITIKNVDGAVDLQSTSGDMRLESVTGKLKVSSMSGDVTATGVGADANFTTISGDVAIKDLTGALTFNSTSGNLRAINVGQDLTGNTISGDVEVICARGRVEVASVSGEIKLSNITGEAEAETTSGDVTFVGPIKVGGRYLLKAFSGEVKMMIPDDVAGFTVKFKSFNGSFESDFPITSPEGSPENSGTRRINGTFGDGRTQLTFDTFSGSIHIVKSATAPAPCANKDR